MTVTTTIMTILSVVITANSWSQLPGYSLTRNTKGVRLGKIFYEWSFLLSRPATCTMHEFTPLSEHFEPLAEGARNIR